MSEYSNFTIIGTTSFGGTGGSALTNILEEFKCIKPLRGGAEFECKFFTNTIFPLETALKNQLYVNAAVKEMLYQAYTMSKDKFYAENFGTDNFIKLTNEYINSVTGVWLGGSYSEKDYFFISKKEQNNFVKAKALFNSLYKNADNLYEQYHWEPSFQQVVNQYYGKFTDDFYTKTQEYTAKLFNITGEKQRFVLVDSIFRPETAVQELNWYTNAKFIIVDRDPRDHYIINKIYWGDTHIPTWNVDSYIDWFKTYRSCNERNSAYPEKILQLRFEDLIYKYEESLVRIKTFLSLTDDEHIKKGQVFIPEKSRTNTQVFRKHPEYAGDIRKIEKELSEFCYNYSEEQIRCFESKDEIGNGVIIEDIRKQAIIFQKTGRLPFSNFKGAFLFSLLYLNCMTLRNRKTFFSKIKGFIKIFFSMIIFPADFLYKLIYIIQFQSKNKNKIVEFR